MIVQYFRTRSDTFTAAGNGATVSILDFPSKSFSISVKRTDASATAWSVVLEGSLNAVEFSTILTHVTATGDGAIQQGALAVAAGQVGVQVIFTSE